MFQGNCPKNSSKEYIGIGYSVVMVGLTQSTNYLFYTSTYNLVLSCLISYSFSYILHIENQLFEHEKKMIKKYLFDKCYLAVCKVKQWHYYVAHDLVDMLIIK